MPSLSLSTYAFIAAFLLAAALGIGLKVQTARLHALQAEYGAFRADVKAKGELQAAETAKTVQAQKEITANAQTDYAKKLAALRVRFAAGGVPVATRPDGSAVAQVSCAPSRTDGPAANPVPAVAQADFDQLAGLAAQTTQQLVSLQDWVRAQMAVFR